MINRTARPWHRPPTPARRYLPEGPLVLPDGDGPGPGVWLAWVVIEHGPGQPGSVDLRHLAGGGSRSLPLPGRPGFIALTTRPGTLVVGLDRDLVTLDLLADRPEPALLAAGVAEPGTLINDGIATPFGLVFGTKDPAFEDPIGGVYLLRHDEREPVRLRGGVVCSNGKAVVRRDSLWLLYDIDSPTRLVTRHRLDPAAGVLGPAAPWLDLTDEPHVPDGMRLTPDGGSVVIAFYHPGDPENGVARRYRLRDAALLDQWQVPRSPRVTCPAFVDHPDGVGLVLTTAVEGMPAPQRRLHRDAGTLFWADTDLAGPVPRPHRFGLAGGATT